MEGQFLEKIVRFLKEVEWLYDFPVTQVFTRNVLSQIPEEWHASFADLTLSSLNGIPECRSQIHWPSSLKQFLKQCKELSLQQWISTSQHEYDIRKSPMDLILPKELSKGMSPKKKHEVTTMVQCVKELCDITNASRILDIGSGMGYVDSALHHALGVTIVGAESEDCRVRDAQKRQNMLTGTCEGIRHMKWLLQDDQATLDKALEIVNDLADYKALCICRLNCERIHSVTPDTCTEKKKIDFPEDTLLSQSTMLIGLHSCADLSPVMIKIFKHCPKISSVLLFSCCYHKLKNIELEENSKEKENSVKCEKSEKVCILDTTEVFVGAHKNESIEPCCSNVTSTKEVKEVDKVNTINHKNFPMSNTLKQIMKLHDFHLSIYGLRLAAQESGIRWLQHTKEDHENHERNVAYRALLEVFCQKEGITLKKCRRRCARKSKFCSFNEYITAVLENYEFIPAESQALNCASIESFVTEESFSETIKASEKGSCLSESKECNVELGLKNKNPLSKEFIRDRLKTCFSEYEDIFYLIEPLTGLQLALQPVLEALILLDRVVYLKEAKFDKVWLEEVFDDALSPRNVALIAVR